MDLQGDGKFGRLKGLCFRKAPSLLCPSDSSSLVPPANQGSYAPTPRGRQEP